jgi:ParB/RepB/Spo0J family partition protein
MIKLVNSNRCTMWACHDRLPELLSEKSCRDVIQSMRRDGQKHPVLARPCDSSQEADYELIYGARRLFAAQQLGIKLLIDVREDLSDQEAFIQMDIENRLRRDISAYERGMSFKAWLREGYFSSQESIAKALGLSQPCVSRLMKFSELPAVVVSAFPDCRSIRESWAVTLAAQCADPSGKKKLIATARAIAKKRTDTTLSSKEVFRLLIDAAERKHTDRVQRRDDIIKSETGVRLFRVSYRHNDLQIIIPRNLAAGPILRLVVRAVRCILERQSLSTWVDS